MADRYHVVVEEPTYNELIELKQKLGVTSLGKVIQYLLTIYYKYEGKRSK